MRISDWSSDVCSSDLIKSGQGFIAALDQSGGPTPKALKGYGIEADAFSNDEEMFGLIHDMRSRIVTAPCFNGDKVIGAILFERTMDGEAGGKPVPRSEEHTSELQSLMRISYAVFCLKNKKTTNILSKNIIENQISR